MKTIKDFLVNESNNEIKNITKKLTNLINKTPEIFGIFMNELYHNIDDNNPDEFIWELLKENYEKNGWEISRKLKT